MTENRTGLHENELGYPFRETVYIPTIGKENWPQLDIKGVLFVCQANLGRSLMAELIAKKAQADGILPEFPVFSAAIDGRFSAVFGQESPEMVLEVLRAYGHEIYRHNSRNLLYQQFSGVDVVALVDDAHISDYIYAAPHSHKCRSLTGINLPDPSIVSAGISFEQNLHITYKTLTHIIRRKLPGILLNIRENRYTKHKLFNTGFGVIHPFRDQASVEGAV